MSKVEHCIFRVESSEQVPNVEIGVHPPMQIEHVKRCQVLVQKGTPDTTCYNLDLNQFTCPISPEYRHPNEKKE